MSKLSEIKCNFTQLEKLHKAGMPNDITKLVDAVEWLYKDKEICISVVTNNFYKLGMDSRIIVRDQQTTIEKISYERYGRCLMEGLDIALDFLLDYLWKEPIVDL